MWTVGIGVALRGIPCQAYAFVSNFFQTDFMGRGHEKLLNTKGHHLYCGDIRGYLCDLFLAVFDAVYLVHPSTHINKFIITCKLHHDVIKNDV